jgi:plastocyanin
MRSSPAIRRLCSLALGLVSLAFADGSSAAPAGAIVGHVRYLGTRVLPPVRVPAASVKDCGKTQSSPALIVAKDKALANAVVSVAGARAAGPLAPVEVSITQQSCEFAPHVVAVPVGSRLTFVNSDLCLHNVHLMADGVTVSNIAMPLQGQRSKLPVNILAKPGNVHFKCDVHSWMDGYVHVFDHPFFAVTDKTGAFRIAGVPPGAYELRIQHEILGTSTRKVTVGGDADVNMDVELK